MIIDELLSGGQGLRQFAAQPEMDPLTEEDALQEAQILELRLDAVRSRVGVLFELRTALQLREGNTGVLVANGVRSIAWEAAPRATRRTAWNVVGSVPNNVHGLLDLVLSMWPEGRLHLIAEDAAFFVGNVPDLQDAPPSYVESDDDTLHFGIAGWGSAFVPVHAVFLNASYGLPNTARS